MSRIERVAAGYRANGHKVVVLSVSRCQVTDRIVGNVYRVDNYGNAIVGTALAAELEAEAEEPPVRMPGYARR